jgi:hypothetical protein
LVGLHFALVAVLAAVQFDDEPSIHADEIGDISTNRVLPPELRTIQLVIPQLLPLFALWPHSASRPVQYMLLCLYSKREGVAASRYSLSVLLWNCHNGLWLF